MNTTGLSSTEAKKRLEQVGPNEIVKRKQISFFKIAREEMTEPLILLLLAVGFFYAIWGDIGDVITIFVVIIIVIFVEVWNEYRAKKTISSLSEMAAPKARVLREGKITEVRSEEVVPEDILILIAGTRIAADSIVISTYGGLQVDESPLTGESFPKEKGLDDEVYAGTLVISGEGKAQVFVTGKDTRFGKISVLAGEIREPKTPLQILMKSLAKSLVWIAIFFSVALPLLGFFRGQDFRQMVLTGLSLAFATIPEELPVIITIVLGLGAYRLSQKNFLVKKIKAAEVLGSSTIILTDKTGTITENKMQVVYVFPENRRRQVIENALAAVTDVSLSGTDKAILGEADKMILKNSIPVEAKVIRQRSFGNGKKTKAVLRDMNVDGRIQLIVIGAPEEILTSVTLGDKAIVEETLSSETSKGRRVIAVAKRPISQIERIDHSLIEIDLEFVGLISVEDPPREEVKRTVEVADKAGIRTIMVTGDHPQTASYVAKVVGIRPERSLTGAELDRLSDEELRSTVSKVSVYARASPEHKYRIVKALRENGEIVAVTGDGVNDTLALKGADIGISMGIKGTDAAKEAADVVLVDDNFVTICDGIFEGRKVFDNFRKAIKYYLSAKVALISTFLVPAVFDIPFPFAPIQIIILELFMDLGASAAFVSEKAERTIYTRPPRNPKTRFLNSQMIRGIAISGLSLFAAVSFSYFYALWWLHLPLELARTFAFAAWIMGHIILAFVSRSEVVPLASIGLFSNKIMNMWAIAVSAFMLIVIAVPHLGFHLKIAPLTFTQLSIILGICLLFIPWQEVRKILLVKEMKVIGR
jgi:P-type Ca2+ transporter type 2C